MDLLFSINKQGFLLFGPYLPMQSGYYHLILREEGGVKNATWVDVASH